ncbi:Imm49 family immunity protein [Aquabacterium lacunae]|nr:Imm49 family immunity protein [Aquabacterium lacunae]
MLAAEEMRLPDSVKRFSHERVNVRLGAVLTGICQPSQTRGMVAYFLHGDLTGLKQNFYVASRLTLMSFCLDGGSDFSTGWPLFYALLSDNPQIINEMAQATTPYLLEGRDDPRDGAYIIHMQQLAALGDDVALRAKLERLGVSGPKEFRATVPRGQDFFSLLLARDQAGLEELIQRDARRKDNDPLTEDFLSYLGVLEAKLCWLRGIQVQIDHPKVPMALMPIEPLDHYDDEYEFLKPGWVPPPQGVMGKLKRWLGK